MKRFPCSDISGQTNINDENQQKQNEIYMKDLMSKFHRIVSNGPVYVCSYRDQLWYQHSVSCTDKQRKRNPGVYKYLFNKASVDKIEWACTSSNNYLSTNKVPKPSTFG